VVGQVGHLLLRTAWDDHPLDTMVDDGGCKDETTYYLVQELAIFAC